MSLVEKLSPKRNKVEEFLSFCFALFAMAILLSARAYLTPPVLGGDTVNVCSGYLGVGVIVA